MSEKPRRLAGHTVVVTRSPEEGAALQERLEAEGARVLLLPTIRIEDSDDVEGALAALTSLGDYDGIILGSQNAAERLIARARRFVVPLERARFFVVGEKTARYVSERVPGAQVESPATYRAEALVELIAARFGHQLRGRRFLFPRAPEGREFIQDELGRRGAEVDTLLLYHIVPASPPGPELQAALEGADVLTFLSGRTLENWLRVLPEPVARRHLERATVAVIGPVAKEAADRLGVRVDIVPETATLEGLVEALATALGGPKT